MRESYKHQIAMDYPFLIVSILSVEASICGGNYEDMTSRPGLIPNDSNECQCSYIQNNALIIDQIVEITVSEGMVPP
jgi:hypothetical protein